MPSLEPKLNRQIILSNRPKGLPALSHFKLIETKVPEIKEGEVLVRVHYLSVDPYMRFLMSDSTSYLTAFEVDKPLLGDGVGKVVESKHSNFKAGDFVKGYFEWADYCVLRGEELQKIDPNFGPITTALDVLGMPGMTAYFGFLDVGKPLSGETVVISGAAGAVGSMVGQIAKIKECRVIGIAGSDEKVNFLKKELKFDGALNYKKANFEESLNQACGNGVDIYFDNVGGDITDQVLKHLNTHARIVICGQISMYNLEKPDNGPRPFRILLGKSAMAKGFIVTNYLDLYPEGMKQMAQWYKEGKIKNKESIVSGLENAPSAFLGLFKGENIGKQLVKVA